MEIVNVLTLNKGVLQDIKSYVIPDVDIKEIVVQQAEDMFKAIAKIYGCDDIDTALENGSYDDQNGKEVLLTWSEVVIEPAEEELTLYQLLDGEEDQAGLVETNATEEVVQGLWKAIMSSSLTDVQLSYLDNNGLEDEADSEKLCGLLDAGGYIVNRQWVTEINC